mmetsp:Transcript_60550/g.179468  ORF Transcript_60550/g.179468 Transcript_60550/m.179468 type:complete len:328 (+) Transcript_60550:601-1584(+)
MLNEIMMRNVSLPLAVLEKLEILGILLGDARQIFDPLDDLLRNRIFVALVLTPSVRRRPARRFVLVVRPVEFTPPDVRGTFVSLDISQVDQAFGLLLRGEFVELYHPRADLVSSAIRVSALGMTGTGQNRGLVLGEFRITFVGNAKEHGVQIAGTPHVQFVGIEGTPNVEVDPFARAAHRCALQFHVVGIRLAFSDGRPERAQFVLVATREADRFVPRLHQYLAPHVVLRAADELSHFTRVFVLRHLLLRAHIQFAADLTAPLAVHQHVIRIRAAFALLGPFGAREMIVEARRVRVGVSGRDDVALHADLHGGLARRRGRRRGGDLD